MSQSPSWTALQTVLERAESDLARGDAESANIAMAAAANICRSLQGGGLQLSPQDAAALQNLTERCGTSLGRLVRALNAASLRDDNRRRALLTYQASRSR